MAEDKNLKLQATLFDQELSAEIPENFINKLSITSVIGLFFTLANFFVTGFLLLFIDLGIEELIRIEQKRALFILLGSSISLSIAVLIVTMFVGVFVGGLKIKELMTFLFWVNPYIFGVFLGVTQTWALGTEFFTKIHPPFIYSFFVSSTAMILYLKFSKTLLQEKFKIEIMKPHPNNA